MIRYLPLWLALVSACSSEDADQAVLDLSAAQQRDLCRNFVADFCAQGLPDTEDFCADSCISDAATCGAAVEADRVRQLCAVNAEREAVFRSDVAECGETADMDQCISTGGGCMFDVLEAQCGARTRSL